MSTDHPTLVYEDDAVQLWHGDCAAVLPSIEEFDHVLTDPPYDEETHRGARSDLRSEYGVRFAPLDDPAALASALQPRRWALVFCSIEMLGTYRRAAADRWVRSGIWDRIDGAPQFSGDRPAQAVEGIAIWHAAGAKRWNGGGKRGIWRCGIVRGEERVHETQKPLALMRDLILDFTDVGETIFDPFAGSGTTGVAAKICGRKAVLFEIDGGRCALAARRLAEASIDERIARVPDQRARQGALVFNA